VTIAAVLLFGMKIASNATAENRVTQAVGDEAAATRGDGAGRREGGAGSGMWRPAVVWGFVGVLGFSFSLPATRLAVEDLDPTFVGLGRALVAAVLAGALLAARREALPRREDLPRFALVGIGVVVGFPIFTSVALHHLTSAHGSVITGLLPAATAAMAVARAGERPPPAFWFAATAGLIAVLAFAATQGVNGIETADVLVLVAVAFAALGYAEGGALSRTYGGWQVICWALVFTAPFVLIPVTVAASHGVHAGTNAWLGFAYVSVISMFLAFFAWYHGLALGGVAKIGQIQLAQPVLTLLWAALILGETVTPAMLIAALVVLACVIATQRTRASAHDERGRRGAVDAHLDVGQRAVLPGGAHHAEDDDVVHAVAVPVPRVQHPLAPEPDPLQRPL
jgi:drug/metabolite transporter (DMT)-like permease